MTKVKFKCDQCKVSVKRSPEKLITDKGKKFCTEICLTRNKRSHHA